MLNVCNVGCVPFPLRCQLQNTAAFQNVSCMWVRLSRLESQLARQGESSWSSTTFELHTRFLHVKQAHTTGKKGTVTRTESRASRDSVREEKQQASRSLAQAAFIKPVHERTKGTSSRLHLTRNFRQKADVEAVVDSLQVPCVAHWKTTSFKRNEAVAGAAATSWQFF